MKIPQFFPVVNYEVDPNKLEVVEDMWEHLENAHFENEEEIPSFLEAFLIEIEKDDLHHKGVYFYQSRDLKKYNTNI